MANHGMIGGGYILSDAELAEAAKGFASYGPRSG
jgi:hypothetical protein